MVSFFEFGSPESEVVSDELHDCCGVFVLVLFDLVDIGDGIVEGLLGELAGDSWVVFDFVVEDRVVQGESQSNGVGGLEVGLSSLGGSFVGFVGISACLIVGTA